ncbi:copper-translocating P-type ATPase [Motiliproteus sp. MSK22-1]|nr:copper-translocating P-type ATPase [Motiliproteus sp. MSK22-1]
MQRVDSNSLCFHCGLFSDSEQAITRKVEGEARLFCCHGCASVCEAIFSAGLNGFYQRRMEGDFLAPPPEIPKELAFYDLDEIQQDFVTELGAEREVQLLVEGIHCAACVWLIENSLRRISGVIDARVNLTGRRLQIRWDNEVIPLSSIIRSLGMLGYNAVPFDPEAAEGSLKRENRKLLYRMAVAGFAMMNLLWISIALYTGADQGEFREMFHWIGLALATPTLLYSGFPFYSGAWAGLKNRSLGMDLPIALGATITYLYSVYVTLSGTTVGEVYFDTVVNFLFVILVGRYLEAISKRQAVASTQRLLDLQPKVANLIRDGDERVVPIRSVALGDIVVVRPGERIPADGTVVAGASSIDEAMLTGESEPVSKKVGSSVCAGTINGQGMLRVEVSGLLNNTALGRIIHLVEQAQSSKAPIQSIADRIVPWFVATTIGLALATFSWWFNVGIEQALMAATAVLIITCPCAFGLATPMSIAVASGLGARNGILVRNGETLESLSGITHFVFDKTGTLTEGIISVVSIKTLNQHWSRGDEVLSEDVKALMTLVYAAEHSSEHPVASAVRRFSDEFLNKNSLRVESFISEPGFGISAMVEKQLVHIGTAAWMDKNGVTRLAWLDEQAESLDAVGIGSIRCAIDNREVAVLGIEDTLREDSIEVVSKLKQKGMGVTLLSGDRQATAETVAKRLGGMEVIAEVLPADKDKVIAALQAQGHRVAMVGDGVNDAPALVRADVGIALGSGTDVSIASADIVLMSNELKKVLLVSNLSQRTLKAIRQNIAISISYNLIMVPLAMAALVTPLVAAITMPISSLLVIGNAARIHSVFRKRD